MTFENFLPTIRRRRGAITPGRPLDFFDSWKDLDRLVEEVFTGRGLSPETARTLTETFRPSVSFEDGEKAYIVKAELPGLDEKDVEVHYEDGVLTLKGEKRREHKEKENGRVYEEHTYGAFSRSFETPDIDSENIAASMKKGILSITLPKLKAEEKKKIAVTVKEA